MVVQPPIAERSSWLDSILRPFSKVKRGEGLQAMLLLATVFLILTSYYLMKTAREGLILSVETFGLRGEEVKSYAGGAMAVLLLGIVPAYGALAQRVKRINLINVSYLITIGCLIIFYVLGQAGVSIGLVFFIWIGLVNMFLIAQFWSYANDLYNEEQGKRLFAIIAIGGSLGAVAGPEISKLGSTYVLMPMAAAILGGCLFLFNLIERLHKRDAKPDDHTADDPIDGDGAWSLVLRDRYLLLLAALVLVAELVKTNGEFVLSSAAAEHASALLPAERRDAIKDFYATFFLWVNILGFVMQAFLVSRIIQKLGVRRALFVMPIVALGSYAAIGAIGGLLLVRVAKVFENSTEYSVQNTVRQTLFLPTTRAAKYKAKALIDTFVVRFGDTLSAVMVWGLVHELGMNARGLALVNVALVAVWIAIAIGIARRHRKLVPEEAT